MILDNIPPGLLDLSPLGALVLVLVLQFRAVQGGKWVPRSLHDARIADKDARIADLLTANTASARQAEKLTSMVETQVRILQEIEELAERRGAP